MKRGGFKLCISIFAAMFLFLLSFASGAEAYSASVDKTSLTQGECLTLTWSGFGDICNIIVYKGSTPWVYANTQAPYQGTQQICTDGWEIRSDYKIRVEQKSNTTIYVYTQTFAVLGPKPYLLDFLVNGGAASTASRNVYLQFNFTTIEPTYYMASESSSFYGASWIAYTGSKTVNFTLSDGAGTKFVYFKLKNAYGESNVKWDTISYAPVMYYDVSGYIKNEAGQAVEGVVVGGFPSGNATTDVNGNYIMPNIISTWIGTVTPSKSGYTFSPSSRSYSGLSGDLANQNFTAIPNVTYSWQTGEWSACNDTCCGGSKTRTVQCIESVGGEAVSDSYCTGTKPESISYDCPELGASRLCNDLGGEMYE